MRLITSVAVGLGFGVAMGLLLFGDWPAQEPTQWSIHLVRAWPFALGATTGWLWLVLRALFRVPQSLQPRPLLHTSARLLLAASALGVALALALPTAELSSEQRAAVAVAILERFDR